MKTTLTLTAEIEIDIPQLPSFIRTSDGRTVPIEDFDTASLAKIADTWKQALIQLAGERANGQTK